MQWKSDYNSTHKTIKSKNKTTNNKQTNKCAAPVWGKKYGKVNKFEALEIWNTNTSITGIRISSKGKHANSIELQGNNTWQGKHGGDGGDVKTLKLERNEYFNKVEIKSSSCIDCIKFVTNKSRNISVGGNGDGLHSEGGGNKCFVGMRGRSYDMVYELEFLWIDHLSQSPKLKDMVSSQIEQREVPDDDNDDRKYSQKRRWPKTASSSLHGSDGKSQSLFLSQDDNRKCI